MEDIYLAPVREPRSHDLNNTQIFFLEENLLYHIELLCGKSFWSIFTILYVTRYTFYNEAYFGHRLLDILSLFFKKDNNQFTCFIMQLFYEFNNKKNQ